MPLPLIECECRRVVKGSESFFCEHPLVTAADGIVSASVCRACRFAGTPRPVPHKEHSYRSANPFLPPLTVAVVIPCHKSARFLADSIESALAQSVRPAEILVIIDGMDDDFCDVAEKYLDQEIRVLRVNFGNRHAVRRLGFQQTTSSVLCFLDADDILGSKYLEQGLAQFEVENVGIVYSDVYRYGASESRTDSPHHFDKAALHCQNFIHTGSLVRRDCLEITEAFACGLDSAAASITGDWWLWKCVTAGGWTASRNAGRYHKRTFVRSVLEKDATEMSYFQTAWLDREVITLFVPLSGRTQLWAQMAEFLEKQTWSHDQIRLILLDTSQSTTFADEVRNWLARCDYGDVRYVRKSLGPATLADQPRLKSVTNVRCSMARIYNFLKTELTTELVWVLEDDILPPLDVARRLLEHFDERTGSVAAPYRSRFHDGYVAWYGAVVSFTEPQVGVTKVGGNGFGCTIVRSGLIRNTTFSHAHRPPDCDRAFYAGLWGKGHTAKVNWDVECLHFSTSGALANVGIAPIFTTHEGSK